MAEQPQQPVPSTDLVMLVVGGVTFETSRATLTSVADSGLAKFYQVSSSSVHHFDRDPDIFRVILNALRRRTTPVKPDFVRTEDWEADLRFWGMMQSVAPSAKPASVPTTPSPEEPQPPAMEEVTVQDLLVPGHQSNGGLLYRLPRGASCHPTQVLNPRFAKTFTTTLWIVIQQLIINGSHGESGPDGSWRIALPFRVLRRVHHLDKVAPGAGRFEANCTSIHGGSLTSNWFAVHTFLRGNLTDTLPAVPQEVFDAAIKVIFKGFADQRLNEDLRYEISVSGSGDTETLHISFVRRSGITY